MLRDLEHKPIERDMILKFREKLRDIYHYLKKCGIGAPDSYNDVISRYSCAKRKRYEMAYEQILFEGLDYYHDSAVNTFVKVAKFDVPVKWNKNKLKLCRTVNTRSYKFTLELLRYIHPIEKAMMDYTWHGYPCIAKGKSLRQRAIDIHNIFYSFADPVVISLDLTAFDMHITKQMLREEFKLYNELYHQVDDIRRLTSAMLVNRITTEHGIKKKISGQRMSGDATTACGNVIQMITILKVAMEGIDFKFYDDGDDCLLFIDSSKFKEVKKRLMSTYSAFGHELKIENVAHEYSDIVFCQHRPFENESTGELMMIPDVWKVLSTMTSHYKYYNEKKFGLRMFKTIMYGYASVYRHVPIIAKYAIKFVKILSNVKMLENFYEDDNEHYYWFRINNVNLKKADELIDMVEHSFMDPTLMAFLQYYYDMGVEDVEDLLLQIDAILPSRITMQFKKCESGYYSMIEY
jgi:hypothetical protein